jgi:hypothetical protein
VVAVHEKAAAAYIASYGQHHSQRKLHGHGGIVGIAALLHNIASYFGRRGVSRYH